jgi:hypothetical protein
LRKKPLCRIAPGYSYSGFALTARLSPVPTVSDEDRTRAHAALDQIMNPA